MKTSRQKNIFFLLMSLGALVLSVGFGVAQTLPTYNENRTITSTGTTMNMTNGCNPYKAGAFYEGSKVYYFLLSETLRPDSYGIFKESYAWVYGYNNVIPNTLKLPFIANVQPKDGSPGLTDTKILVTEARDANFTIPAGYSTPRNQPAAQIVTRNQYRILRTTQPFINYFYTNWNAPTTQVTMSASQNFSPNITWKTACYTYYVAYCGDGVVDTPTGNSDGNGGIQTATEGFKSWDLENTVTPNEVCDDGPLNGQPGYCNIDCTGLTPGGAGPSCTLTPSSSTIEEGQTITLTASYTSGTSATFTPSLTGMDNFTYPTWNGTATDTPNTTTTYTLTVEGETGTQPAVCSTSVTVTEPEPHLECTLTLSPSITGTGQIVSVGWNVSNGNFFGTYIYVNPPLAGAWPHWVNANQYNGVSSVMATQTGTYTFTMMVNNNQESAICTGVLNVVDPVGPCTLTTDTPVIYPGQTGNLHASYFNATLATFTPNIAGLNLVYPHRSATGIIVQPTNTTTYTLNVLGVNNSQESCSTTIVVMNTGLQLNKTLLNNIVYQSGDLVTFKIDFANNGPNIISNMVLSDYLPASLEYINSQLFGVTPPYNFGTGIVGNNQFVEYSGFDLAPGQQGYMLVVGRFKGYQRSNQTLNNAFAKGDNTPLVYASALFTAYNPSSNATTIKTSDKPSYFPGEAAQFTIAITNNGPDAINSVTITDIRPSGSCVLLDSQWASNMPLTVGSTTNPYTWTYNGNLGVGQTLYLYLTGNISNDNACLGTYTNQANISYTVNNQTYTGSAQPLNFTVSTTPSSTMLFEKRLVSYGNNTGDPVVFELLYQNQGNATITNFDIVDYRPGTLNFVSASPMPTTQTPMVGGTELRRIITTPLAPNGTGKITINGTIK